MNVKVFVIFQILCNKLMAQMFGFFTAVEAMLLFHSSMWVQIVSKWVQTAVGKANKITTSWSTGHSRQAS